MRKGLKSKTGNTDSKSEDRNKSTPGSFIQMELNVFGLIRCSAAFTEITGTRFRFLLIDPRLYHSHAPHHFQANYTILAIHTASTDFFFSYQNYYCYEFVPL